MTKYASLIFREFKISKKHYFYRVLMLAAFIFLFIIALIVLSNDRTRNGVALDGFALMAMYLIGAIVAIIIAEDNGVFKSDVNSGWLRYSRALPLSAFEKAMAKYIFRMIMIIIGFAVCILSSLVICSVTDSSMNTKGILTMFLLFDVSLIFNIVIEAFIMRATDKKALKKMSYIISAILVAILFLPEFINFDSMNGQEESLEQTMQSVEKTNELLRKLVLPDAVLYASVALMAVILITGFIITMKNFGRREL